MPAEVIAKREFCIKCLTASQELSLEERPQSSKASTDQLKQVPHCQRDRTIQVWPKNIFLK